MFSVATHDEGVIKRKRSLTSLDVDKSEKESKERRRVRAKNQILMKNVMT